MKRDECILVVGGAGYIGSHTTKALARKGYKTVVMDNLVYGHREFLKWGSFVHGDLNNKRDLDSLFETYSIKTVLHFAAFAYVGESVSDPRKYYVNNVCNTMNLLNAMVEHDVPNIIFSSTCATYGNPVEIPIPETHPQNPVNPYGRTKLMVEQALADYGRAYGIRHVSLRYFNAAGADPEGEVGEWHEPETHLIPLVLDAAMGVRKNIEIYGTDYDTPDGSCVRDYIHVSDLADAHVLALEYLESGGQSDAFNLGNGNGFSVKNIVDIAGRVTGNPVPVIESGRRPGDNALLVGDAAKAKAMLRWRPQYGDIDAIIQTAWDWHTKQRSNLGKERCRQLQEAASF